MHVVALGAVVELAEADSSPERDGTVDFSVSEFAVLDEGHRLPLHDERRLEQRPGEGRALHATALAARSAGQPLVDAQPRQHRPHVTRGGRS